MSVFTNSESVGR